MKYEHCRYGENVKQLFGDWKVLKDESYADYQGEVRVLFFKDGKWAFVQFYYGSCSGCDDWEARKLNDAQINNEILNLTMRWNNESDMEKFFARAKF